MHCVACKTAIPPPAEPAELICWQCCEERRHDGAATLTAVRTWPLIERMLAVERGQARDQFIEIITRFKIQVSAEARIPTRKQIRGLGLIRDALRRNDNDAFENAVAALMETEAGRSALVRYHHRLRRDDRDPGHPNRAGFENLGLLRDALKDVRKEVKEQTKAGRGVSPMVARDAAIKDLIAWWDEHAAHAGHNSTVGHARLPDGSFNGRFIDFLDLVSEGLNAHRSVTNGNRNLNPVRRVSQRLSLGSNREAIIAALAKQK